MSNSKSLCHPYARPGGFPGTQVILPLAHTVEHEEFLEVVRLEGHAFSPKDIALARDMYLLQLCSGLDENAAGGCAQLVFAPIDETCADDAPLLPSGFRVIPLDPKSDNSGLWTWLLHSKSDLVDIILDKVLDEAGRKVLLSEFSKIMQQGFAYLPAGICVSSMGRPISYDQAIAWKVLTDDNSSHCLAFMFLNWSFV
ncbi:hypothetical protein POM88_036956 [Heracleum sosnowskyi]|uniref:MEKHLA domain-containing protein n=1 Tax=Heracleum sosnowskyi TaxID=360622 RepID=A0AAD8MFI2_9APIA|nr:hypothetical protein POM88_036956 [Heracleum sosnowskyi]